MATGTLPDAGQILNSLINSILLVDDDLAVHFANPAAQQLLAQSSRKLFGTPLPELLSYFSLNIGLMQESLQAGQTWNIFPTLAQRRQMHPDHVQAVE